MNNSDNKSSQNEYPKTFEELFKNSEIKSTVDSEGNTHYNFKATKKMEDKYFAPSIEDIRVGYECETQVDPYPNWIATKIEDGNDIQFIQDRTWAIRIPYLTKEQIEGEGWSKEMKKDRFELQQVTIIADNSRKDWLIIMEKLKDKTQCVFKGECKDINTFRYICKLLNIN